MPSDEAFEDMVHRQLRLDASTAHLQLHVGSLEGVVRLQGTVATGRTRRTRQRWPVTYLMFVEVIDELTRA